MLDKSKILRTSREKGGERDDKPFDRERKPFDGDRNSSPIKKEKEHGDEITARYVTFKEPTLGVENERPVIRGRRNGWKRNDGNKDTNDTNND